MRRMREADDANTAELVELTREIARAYQRLKVFSNRSGIFHDYGGAAAEIISLLYHSGEHSVVEIARIRSVSRQFVVKLARELEAEGTIGLRDDVPGKRGYVLALTEQGRSAWEVRQKQFSDAIATLPVQATAEEIRMARELLRRIGSD